MGFLAEVTPIFQKKGAGNLVQGGFFIQRGSRRLIFEEFLPADACYGDRASAKQQRGWVREPLLPETLPPEYSYSVVATGT